MNNFKAIFNTAKSENHGRGSLGYKRIARSKGLRLLLLWLPVVLVRVLMLSVVMFSVMTLVLTLVVKHTVNIIVNCIGSHFGARCKKGGDKNFANAGSTVQYTELFFTRKDDNRLSTASTVSASKAYASAVNKM